MPRNGKDNDKSYLEILIQLRELIKNDYKEGGWLASGRKLSAQLKVDRRTLLKALDRIRIDGIVKSYPQKGYYVNPEEFRIKKIGIVINKAEVSPFMSSLDIFNELSSSLALSSYDIHLIQGNSHDDVLYNAEVHGTEALIWMSDSNNDLEQLSSKANSYKRPLIVISKNIIKDCDKFAFTCICPSYSESNNKKIEMFQSRGHKKIAYVAEHIIAYEKFTKSAKKSGLETIYIPYEYFFKGNDITHMIESEEGVTGVIIDGNSGIVNNIFSQVSASSACENFEFFVFNFATLPLLLKKYPDVKVVGIGYINQSLLGNIAAKMLVNYLNKSGELKSQYVDWLKIIPPSEILSNS